jgi:hypothetical protein
MLVVHLYTLLFNLLSQNVLYLMIIVNLYLYNVFNQYSRFAKKIYCDYFTKRPIYKMTNFRRQIDVDSTKSEKLKLNLN